MHQDNTTNQLGRYLRAHREDAGLTIRHLASIIGMNHGYLVRLESGEKTNPSADVLHKLADALELDPAELLAFIGITPSSTLPPARVYFRKKYGLSEADARRAAQLIEQYTKEEGKDKKQATKEVNNDYQR